MIETQDNSKTLLIPLADSVECQREVAKYNGKSAAELREIKPDLEQIFKDIDRDLVFQDEQGKQVVFWDIEKDKDNKDVRVFHKKKFVLELWKYFMNEEMPVELQARLNKNSEGKEVNDDDKVIFNNFEKFLQEKKDSINPLVFVMLNSFNQGTLGPIETYFINALFIEANENEKKQILFVQNLTRQKGKKMVLKKTKGGGFLFNEMVNIAHMLANNETNDIFMIKNNASGKMISEETLDNSEGSDIFKLNSEVQFDYDSTKDSVFLKYTESKLSGINSDPKIKNSADIKHDVLTYKTLYSQEATDSLRGALDLAEKYQIFSAKTGNHSLEGFKKSVGDFLDPNESRTFQIEKGLYTDLIECLLEKYENDEKIKNIIEKQKTILESRDQYALKMEALKKIDEALSKSVFYHFKIESKKVLDYSLEQDPDRYLKQCVSSLILDDTSLETEKEALAEAAETQKKNKKALETVKEEKGYLRNLSLDLYRAKVEIDGEFFNNGAHVNFGAPKSVKEELHQKFNSSRELGGLYQSRMAEITKFFKGNFELSGKEGHFMVSSDNSNALYRKKGDVYSYECDIFCFNFIDLADALPYAWHNGKFDNPPEIPNTEKNNLAWYKKNGYEPFLQGKVVFSVDLTNVPPQKPNATVDLKVKIGVPEQVKYLWKSRNEIDHQSEVTIASKIKDWLSSIPNAIKNFVKSIATAITERLFKKESAMAKEEKGSVDLPKAETMSEDSLLFAKSLATLEKINIEKTEEKLKSAHLNLKDKYQQVKDKSIQIQDLKNEQNYLLGLKVEVERSDTVKDVLQHYQNKEGDIESTLSKKPDYKSIAIMFELNNEFFPLQMHTCKDPESLIKIFKAAKFSNREIQFSAEDEAILKVKLPNYETLKKSSKEVFCASLAQEELNTLSEYFKKHEGLEMPKSSKAVHFALRSKLEDKKGNKNDSGIPPAPPPPPPFHH